MVKFKNLDLLLETNQKIRLGDNDDRYISFDGTTLVISGGVTISGSVLIDQGNLGFSTGATINKILDQDDLSSDDDNALTTQQSIKAYIDTQINTISGGSFDHGDLQGLSDDDHCQYLLANGTRQLTGLWDFGSQTISGTGKIYGDIEDTNRKSGRIYLADKASTVTVIFNSVYPSTNYIVASTMCNTVDVKPAIYSYTISSKTIGGFTAEFSGKMNSANHCLEWVTILN